MFELLTYLKYLKTTKARINHFRTGSPVPGTLLPIHEKSGQPFQGQQL